MPLCSVPHLFIRLTTGLLLACVLSNAQAAEPTTVNGLYNPKTGTKAPARYNGTGLTQKQMDAAGLPAPDSGSKWVQIGDKYVQLKTVDGTVQSVEPSVK